MTGATGNWYCGLHEYREMGFVLHALRPEDHFLDVGANIGSYTILAGGGVGARVTAVEPIPETFAQLERNVLLNSLGKRARTCRMGLSDKKAVLRFTEGLGCENHVLSENEAGSFVEVPVMSLDELVGDDIPRLIKIDVEGYERSVLRGAQRTLSDRRLLAVIMETNGSGERYGVNERDLVGVMKDYGFSPLQYDPLERSLMDMPQDACNTIFVRDQGLLEERVRTARRYRLINGDI
jgi:FkbM family methyltransferase